MKYYVFLFLVVGFLGQACQRGCESPKNVLVVTDIGTDVDDSEALCLLVKDSTRNIIGVACTASHPEERVKKAEELLGLLGRADIKVGEGSAFIDSLLNSVRGRSDILLIAQATALSEALTNRPSLVKKIGRIYFQGQATVDSSLRLHPDPHAFNVSEDLGAAESLFALQGAIPFTVVGKYAAYPLALSRKVFDDYESSGNPAGALLKRTALESISSFAERSPEVFRKIYNVPDELPTGEAVASLKNISNPYDAVTVLSMMVPECFDPIVIGENTLIGTSEGVSGIFSSKCNILQYRLQTLFLPLRPEKNSLTININL